MEQFIDWNIRAAIYWLMFALAYGLLLRRHVQPTFNRYYLLSWFSVSDLVNATVFVQLPEIIIRAGQQMSSSNQFVISTVETTPFFTKTVVIVSAFVAMMLLLQTQQTQWNGLGSTARK